MKKRNASELVSLAVADEALLQRVGAVSVTTARLKGRPPRSFSTAARFLPRVRSPCHLPDRFTSPFARAGAAQQALLGRVRGALPPAPPAKQIRKIRKTTSLFALRRQISAVSDRHSQLHTNVNVFGRSGSVGACVPLGMLPEGLTGYVVAGLMRPPLSP